MRELGAKMAELEFEAPLAKFEDADEFVSTQNIINVFNGNMKDDNEKVDNKLHILEGVVHSNCEVDTDSKLPSASHGSTVVLGDVPHTAPGKVIISSDTADNFTEALGGSLEDLVNTFDERITKCFGNYEENMEDLAPVQVRSQEEIINECQMWWTITGNFGNILPIDWSKSFARQMHIPTLDLMQNKCSVKDSGNIYDDTNTEDEIVANDLDMHALILNGLNQDDVPIKSVEEIIKEIDDIMDETGSQTNEFQNCDLEVIDKTKEVLRTPLFTENLEYCSTAHLNELYMEMEVLIQELSETLINELALRDELEYEKELKNSFISLLLSVQNKRRQYHIEKKRGKFQGPEPKYLTTVIPYNVENSSPNNHSLQVLIKVLNAINEDSPTAPTLLTDYILKILCPT